MNKIEYIFLAALLFVTGCATIPAPITPESPREVLAFVQTAREAVYNTIADLSMSGALNRAQHDSLMKKMGEADQALILSMVALKAGKPETQIEHLRAARAILIEITRELSTRSPRSKLNTSKVAHYA